MDGKIFRLIALLMYGWVFRWMDRCPHTFVHKVHEWIGSLINIVAYMDGWTGGQVESILHGCLRENRIRLKDDKRSSLS